MKGLSWLAILFIVFFAAASITVGCGDDDDSDDDSGGGSSPEEQKCLDFLELVCSKFASCADVSFSECMSETQQEYSCGDVIDVRDSYAECLDVMEHQSCEELLDADWELPEPCDGVFLVY